MTAPPVTASVLAFPETAGWMLYGIYDVLNSVGTVWGELTTGNPGEALIYARIVAATKEPFSCWGDVPVTPQASLDDISASDIVCVPEMTIPADESPVGRYPREAAWLERMYAGGAVIGTACSGAFLLADTGLLDGQEATTHWAFQERFGRYYPRVKLRAERILCSTGEDGRIVTAGGTSSWHDLCLHLIARFCGVDEARNTAKAFLFEEHDSSQLCFAAMPQQTRNDDAVVRDCQRWLADRYAEPHPLARMIERSGLPPRTFARRFRAATGYTPIDYVRSLRVEEAKQALETTGAKIDDIGRVVGYDDSASFRRLFKLKTGLTPSGYRRK
ncbi:MAG: helix-turn-helix domain-containing protein, partial [Lysobacterales bacterium]